MIKRIFTILTLSLLLISCTTVRRGAVGINAQGHTADAGLGTAALLNTGTGAGDISTNTQGDARWATLSGGVTPASQGGTGTTTGYGSSVSLRRSGGTSRGATNTNVLIYSASDETVGSGITYVNSANNGDSFTVATSGTYAITMVYLQGGVAGAITIRVGASIDNTFNSTSNDLRAYENGIATTEIHTISWTGYVSTADVIYFMSNQTPGVATRANSITITRVS